ncbi:MAG TPA: hypothetical protein DCY13_23245 [Verrucomicrobiales bacterium]|nr:hypothetical protein [Verrucomicrobiales bacterium]
MNVLKYLAVDRSLSTGRDVVGRFQLREDCLLPTFQLPASEAGSDGPVPVNPVEKPSPLRRLIGWLTGRKAAVSLRSEEQSAVESTKSVDVAQMSAPTAATVAFRPKSSEESDQRPEQAEFRFENVRVVCNDLHDADFEIVSAPSSRRERTAQVVSLMAGV